MAVVVLVLGILIPTVGRSFRRSDPAQAEARMRENELQLAVAVEEERQQLAAVRFSRIRETATGLLRAIDSLEEEERRWRTDVIPLLSSNLGRRLATDETSTATFADVFARVESHERIDVEAARARLELIYELADNRLDNPASRNTPSDDYERELERERRAIHARLTLYVESRASIASLAEQADRHIIGERTLETAIAERQRELDLERARAIQMGVERARRDMTAQLEQQQYAQEKSRLEAEARLEAAKASRQTLELNRQAEVQERQAQEAEAMVERAALAHNRDVAELLGPIRRVAVDFVPELYEDAALFRDEFIMHLAMSDQRIALNEPYGQFRRHRYYTARGDTTRRDYAAETRSREATAEARFGYTMHELFRIYCDSAENRKSFGQPADFDKLIAGAANGPGKYWDPQKWLRYYKAWRERARPMKPPKYN